MIQQSDAVTRIAFQFQPPGGNLRQGESFTPDGDSLRVGMSQDVEYWASDPSINRLAGTDALHLPAALSLICNTLLFGGLLCSAFWLRSALRLRLALRDGPCVEAQIIEVKSVPFITPQQIVVRYRFRDHEHQEVIRSHWLWSGCALARTLASEDLRTATVIYDPLNPTISRAVSSEDFLPDASTQRRPS